MSLPDQTRLAGSQAALVNTMVDAFLLALVYGTASRKGGEGDAASWSVPVSLL